jgi:hypothetical protein
MLDYDRMQLRQNAIEGGHSDPRKLTNILLTIIVLTMGFADYWGYWASYHREPGIYLDTLSGTAPAPSQYRLAVVVLGHFLAQHGHLALRHTLTLIDVVAAFLTVFTLLFLLRRSDVYRKAGISERWCASAIFVLLVQFYFAWIVWFQRPETLTTSAFIALTLLLLTWRFPTGAPGTYLATGVCMLALVIIQGFVRADVAAALHAGILLVCLTRAGEGLALPRVVQAVISVLAIVATCGIQYYLARIAYPHTNYGNTPPFQLILNLTHPSAAFPFLLFIGPYAWTVWTLLREMREQMRGPAAALVAGSAVFMGMWFAVGRIEEVRIFLPFAFAIVPITVALAVEKFLPERIS